jgi:hypothetical protein
LCAPGYIQNGQADMPQGSLADAYQSAAIRPAMLNVIQHFPHQGFTCSTQSCHYAAHALQTP